MHFKKGFTLIEMLVVVLVIAILAAIAFVQYAHFLERTRVGEAENLIGLAIYAQERQFMKKSRYVEQWTALDAAPINAYIDRLGDYISLDGKTFYTKGGGNNPNNGYAIHFENVNGHWFAVAQRVGSSSYSYTLVRPFKESTLYCVPSAGSSADEDMCVDIMALDSAADLPQDPRLNAGQNESQNNGN